jgi:adenylosuccinate synthase
LDDIRGYIRDTSALLNNWIAEGKSVLFEGAQGALLDIDHGTYPYVTSSSPTAGGACTGTGVPPRAIDGVMGILKAYTTRVGGGPFVGELEDEQGETLRDRGHEYGTTTGRPRRCGWLDTVAASYSRMINGVDAIALTKLDVLDSLAEIPVCVGYRFKGKLFKDFPAEPEALGVLRPELKVMKGWQKETVGITDFHKLPQEARDYISLIEDQVGAPVVVVSTGPRREETILRAHAELKRLTGSRLEGMGKIPGQAVGTPPRSTKVAPPKLEKRGTSTEVRPPEGPLDQRKPWERER